MIARPKMSRVERKSDIRRRKPRLFRAQVSCTWFKNQIERGRLPYLDPILFDVGLLRGVPHGFEEPHRMAKRVGANAAFWCATIVSFTVAFSYILGVEIAFSGQSYVNMKILYYIPLCFVIAIMNILQLAAEIPEADRKRLENARNVGGRFGFTTRMLEDIDENDAAHLDDDDDDDDDGDDTIEMEVDDPPQQQHDGGGKKV